MHVQNVQGKVESTLTGRECTPKAEQEYSFFLKKLGDLGGGRGWLGSFSVRFEGDD